MSRSDDRGRVDDASTAEVLALGLQRDLPGILSCGGRFTVHDGASTGRSGQAERGGCKGRRQIPTNPSALGLGLGSWCVGSGCDVVHALTIRVTPFSSLNDPERSVQDSEHIRSGFDRRCFVVGHQFVVEVLLRRQAHRVTGLHCSTNQDASVEA